MAQIIKHRRGGLESVSGATKRAGELLVITGSTGISAANDGLLFVGIDGSTVTPANKILSGSSTPNLTGGSYGHSVDGIPFYNTSEEKLYILGKDGNVEVKATASTNGTGIVSSSAQVDSLGFLKVNGDSVISGSSQVFSDISGDITIASNGTAAIGAGVIVNADVNASAAIAFSKINANSTGLVSGSSQVFSDVSGDVTIASNGTAAIGSGVIVNADINNSAAIASSKINYNSTGIVSGSSQVFSDVSGDITIASNGTAAIGAGVITNADINNSAAINHSKIDFDGSGLTSGSLNLTVGADNGSDDVVQVGVNTLTFAGTANEIETTVSDNQIAVGIVTNPTLTGNVIVTGDLSVQGTTTTVDSTTVNIGDNIIALNFGGSSQYAGIQVGDATSPGTESGSLVYNGATNRWMAGQSGSEVNVLIADGDGVVSGSSQVFSDISGDITIASNGTAAIGSGVIVNADINNSAAIALSKINTNSSGLVSGSSQVFSDVSGDITIASNGTAAIGSGVIVNADINNSAAIASSKINYNSTGIVSGSGQITAGSTANFNTDVKARLTAENVISSSAQIDGDFLNTNGDSVVSGSGQLTDMTGDVTVNSSGVSAIGNQKVTNAMLADDAVGADELASNAVVNASVASDAAIASSKINYNSTGIVSGSSQVFSDVSGDVTIASNGTAAIGSGVIVNADINNSAAIDHSKIDFGGSNITSGSLNLTISGSTGNDTVGVGTDALTFAGTANEIETTVTNNQVAIGIVTNPTLTGNVTVTGNLSVEGTTTTIDSTTVNIGDRILELNYGGASGDAGILVSDAVAGNTVSGSLLWDASEDHWMAGALGSEKELARLNASPTSNTVLKANASGLLVDSLITDDGTNVTISGTAELRLNSATANSFAFFNGDKSLESVAGGSAGNLIQYNGSSFVSSNEIDGGTF